MACTTSASGTVSSTDMLSTGQNCVTFNASRQPAYQGRWQAHGIVADR